MKLLNYLFCLISLIVLTQNVHAKDCSQKVSNTEFTQLTKNVQWQKLSPQGSQQLQELLNSKKTTAQIIKKLKKVDAAVMISVDGFYTRDEIIEMLDIEPGSVSGDILTARELNGLKLLKLMQAPEVIYIELSGPLFPEPSVSIGN